MRTGFADSGAACGKTFFAESRRNRPANPDPRKVLGEFNRPFRCGKDAAYCRADTATATAGLWPQRQCFAGMKPRLGDTRICVRVQKRIVKKLTKRLVRSNRLLRRLPEATSRALYGMSQWKLRVRFPLLRDLALPGYEEE